ncbi:hypothetical protein [Parvibaculum sp. MBR-TMA-1.3b-4.2]|jgi:curli biogenesis system outer membrane secretion channel CsgG
MGRYAIVRTETNEVVNVAEWDGESDWDPGDGFAAIASEDAATGWTYDPETEQFSAPAPESGT